MFFCFKKIGPPPTSNTRETEPLLAGSTTPNKFARTKPAFRGLEVIFAVLFVVYVVFLYLSIT